ncbi:MAG: D-alanine--D-alanine ligase, partial [Bacteroidia bacterium]|nr:D-alanine--D-alanine ligase [Bacteroidia bacterium]
MIYSVGKPVHLDSLRYEIDFAFLALHGYHGEDGTVQGTLEMLGIPYSGCGMLGSILGINKILQKEWMRISGFPTPNYTVLEAKQPISKLKEQVKQNVGFPCVLKAPNQGSSIGTAICQTVEEFEIAFSKAALQEIVHKHAWSESALQQIRLWTDVRVSVGFPCLIVETGDFIPSPHVAKSIVDKAFLTYEQLTIQAIDSPTQILVEQWIDGEEFSVIVVQDEHGNPAALPPTLIRKSSEYYDYRSKYLPGMANKITPIPVEPEVVRQICHQAERLMSALHLNVYARIDGFLAKDGTIFLNDPNTTSGMLPSSFFFHQAAEVGITPKDFLTAIVDSSLRQRISENPGFLNAKSLLSQLQELTQIATTNLSKTETIGVILGGWSSERHISVESGRNIYEKLNSSGKYLPIPLFLIADST